MPASVTILLGMFRFRLYKKSLFSNFHRRKARLSEGRKISLREEKAGWEFLVWGEMSRTERSVIHGAFDCSGKRLKRLQKQVDRTFEFN